MSDGALVAGVVLKGLLSGCMVDAHSAVHATICKKPCMQGGGRQCLALHTLAQWGCYRAFRPTLKHIKQTLRRQRSAMSKIKARNLGVTARQTVGMEALTSTYFALWGAGPHTVLGH